MLQVVDWNFNQQKIQERGLFLGKRVFQKGNPLLNEGTFKKESKMLKNKKIGNLVIIAIAIIVSTGFAGNRFIDEGPEIFGDKDSLNIRFVGNWPFSDGCEEIAYDSVRQLVFVGAGGGVYILDVSNPANIQKVSEKIHTNGNVYSLFYVPADQRLYIACYEGGVEMWDVSDAQNPVRLGYNRLQQGDLPNDLHVQGNYCYVVSRIGSMWSGGNSSFTILNVSNPSNPVVVSRITGPTSPYMGLWMGIKVSGNYAYMAWSQSGSVPVRARLYTYNISNPSNPTFVSACSLTTSSEGGAWDLDLKDNYAYVAVGDGGLNIVDISNPVNPVVVGTYNPLGDTHFYDVVVRDNYAYIAEGWSGMRIFDVSNPASITTVGHWSLDSANGEPYCHSLVVSGNRVYTASDPSTFVIDVTNPANPQALGYYTLPNQAWELKVSGSYAYVAYGQTDGSGDPPGGRRQGGMRIINISDPHNPFEAGYFIPPTPNGSSTVQDLDIQGNFAYIPLMNAFGLDLCIVDVSTPSSPQLIGAYNGGWYCNLTNICVSGIYGYATDDDSGGLLRIFDLEEPQSPRQIGVLRIGSNPGEVEVRDTFAFIAYSKGLAVVNVRDPYHPFLVAAESTYRSMNDIVISGDYAYLCRRSAAGYVAIYDISNPLSPYPLVTIVIPNVGCNDLFISGNFLYCAYSSRGLRVYNVSNPANPVLAGYYLGSMNARGVFLADSYAYVADQYAGLQIYDVSQIIGINETRQRQISSGIRLLRNPVRGNIELLLAPSMLNNPVCISLFNPVGQKITSYFVNDPEQKISLPVKNLGSGVYLLVIENGSIHETIKLVVLK